MSVRAKNRAERAAARLRWSRLTPNQRRLILSERQDDFERETEFRQRTMTALENVYGARVWDATLALVAEGEAGEHDWPTASDDMPAMTYKEIGEVLRAEWESVCGPVEKGGRYGFTAEAIRSVEQRALRKLRDLPLMYEMRHADRSHEQALINAALSRATGES